MPNTNKLLPLKWSFDQGIPRTLMIKALESGLILEIHEPGNYLVHILDDNLTVRKLEVTEDTNS